MCREVFQNLDQGPDGAWKTVFLKYGWSFGMDQCCQFKGFPPKNCFLFGLFGGHLRGRLGRKHFFRRKKNVFSLNVPLNVPPNSPNQTKFRGGKTPKLATLMFACKIVCNTVAVIIENIFSFKDPNQMNIELLRHLIEKSAAFNCCLHIESNFFAVGSTKFSLLRGDRD